MSYMSYISWTYCLKNEYSKNLYIKKISWFALNRSNRFAIISSIQRKRVDSFLLVLSNSNKLMSWIVWFFFMSKNANRRFWLFDSLLFNFWSKIVTSTFYSFIIKFFYFKRWKQSSCWNIINNMSKNDILILLFLKNIEIDYLDYTRIHNI